MTQTRITPTFLLKSIDPEKIKADYKAGFFSRKTSVKAPISIANATAILAPVYGATNYSPVFAMKDRNNSSVVIATTGHQSFQVFTKTGGDLVRGGRCDFCKDEFADLAVGYPISYQETSVLVNTSGTPHYRIIYNFWTEGSFCSFECALGYIRLVLSKPADYRDTTIRDSERMLKVLYKLQHPTAGILRPAQDPRLLVANGGSLSREEWADSRHVYTRTDRVLTIPAKIEYIQGKFVTALASDFS